MPASVMLAGRGGGVMQASGGSAGTALIAIAFGACVLGPAAPAGAAFPGANGRIAFDHGISGQFSISSTRADGSDLKELATDAFSPRFDAKGARIVYVATAAGSASGIRVMQSDGSNKQTVTTNADDFYPTWSPGGGQIAFVRGKTLMAIHPDGTSRRTIKTFSTGIGSPSWAPGGGRI